MSVACYITAPITTFRAPRAREYLETLPVPPPATTYGLLLAAVGEENRLVHQGAELAIGVLAPGRLSRVLRTTWRVKAAGLEPGIEQNKRPDFQELLIDVRLAVHVRAGHDRAQPALVDRLERGLAEPAAIRRFGGLSLGESGFLVDELRRLRPGDAVAGPEPVWLIRDGMGPYALPLWPNHVGSRGTRFGQFGSRPVVDLFRPPDEAWVTISGDELEGAQSWKTAGPIHSSE